MDLDSEFQILEKSLRENPDFRPTFSKVSNERGNFKTTCTELFTTCFHEKSKTNFPTFHFLALKFWSKPSGKKPTFF